jgi:uncharacterized protein YutD
MGEYVYLLRHEYEYGEENEYEATRTIGVYSKRKLAIKVIEHLRYLAEYCNYPKNSFVIEKYKIDKDIRWEEGFISWDEASGLS